MLGSTQPSELVDGALVRERGVAVVRRRGGGGAVYLEPGDHLWIDAWIPRHDPLWESDVAVAAEWVGAWWLRALAALGLAPDEFQVHTGRSAPGALGDVACFAGRGPGEVLHASRKVVGLSQWRSREGALFSSCAYARWDPEPLIDLLSVDGPARAELRKGLASVGAGLAEMEPAVTDLDRVRDALLPTLRSWPAPSRPSGG